MHEMGLARSILGESVRMVESRGATRITKIAVEVSPLAAIDSEDLVACFTQVAAGTIAENAVLNIIRLELVAQCSQCGQSVSGKSGATTCPNCGSRSLEVKPMPDWRITAVQTSPY